MTENLWICPAPPPACITDECPHAIPHKHEPSCKIGCGYCDQPCIKIEEEINFTSKQLIRMLGWYGTECHNSLNNGNDKLLAKKIIKELKNRGITKHPFIYMVEGYP